MIWGVLYFLVGLLVMLVMVRHHAIGEDMDALTPIIAWPLMAAVGAVLLVIRGVNSLAKWYEPTKPEEL